jgi:hypothetical protein
LSARKHCAHGENVKLVTEIIEILSSADPDLETALTKAKVLAYKLGEKELLDWVNGELTSYPDDVKVPDYRIMHVQIYGNVSNGRFRYTKHALPTHGIPKDIAEMVLVHPINYSIKVVTELVLNTKDLQLRLTPRLIPFIKKAMDVTYDIEDFWGVFAAGAFTQLLAEVRSRLLDFMLELDARMPNDPAPEDMKQLSKDLHVGEIFKGAVFGQGAVLNLAVGTHNTATQTVTTHSLHNNLDALAKELKDHAVPAADVEELKTAIDADKGASEHEKQDFGPKVKGWILKGMTKATTEAAGLPMKVMTGVVVGAITKYYGFK